MDDPNLSAEIRKKAIQPGIILGIVSLALSIFTFFFIIEIVSSPIMMVVSPLLFAVVIPIIITVFLMLDLRKKIGGFWSFKQATTGAFVIFIVAYAISYVGNLVYTRVIDKTVVERMSATMLDGTERMMENANAPQEKIDEAMDNAKKQMEEQKNLTVTSVTKGLLIAIVMYFILSLIFGAIFKREGVRYIAADEDDPTYT